jgi:nitrate reductase beta subunit
MYRVPYLLRHLQERLDQPRRRRICLVQQCRDQARHRLSQGLGKPEALERRLDPHPLGQNLQPKQGGKWRILANIFANPDLPEIDDFYEPFDFDYDHLKSAPEMEAFPTARPRSKISGERMEKIEWGPNWEEILGGEFAKRSKDYNFEGIQKEIYGEYENTFMMYLPRLCEHCLNPACVASCPSGAIYKREDDGVVLIDQEKCRGWRMCVSGCPYKKIYYNWSTGKVREMHAVLSAPGSGQPTVCSETCVGRIRYLGVMLYDADKIAEAAASRTRRTSTTPARRLPRSERPGSDRRGARRRHSRGLDQGRAEIADLEDGDGMEDRLPAASRIPHPADGLVCAAAVADPERGRGGQDRRAGRHARRALLRIPVRYLANMLTAGDEAPIVTALERMLAMRAYMRSKTVDGVVNLGVAKRVGLCRSRSTRCISCWPSPITRTASSSRPRIANWSRMPMT